MRMSDIPFGTTDWAAITPTEHAGESGKAYWRTREFGGIRVRMVEYTPGYLADHSDKRTNGARRVTCCCASRANCTPSSRMGAPLPSSPARAIR